MSLSNQQIARIILEQLGGNKFVIITGAKNFTVGDATLSFDIPLSNNINKVSVTLDINDAYRVTFSKYRSRKLDTVIIHSVGNVYAQDLQQLFTSQTGLETSL